MAPHTLAGLDPSARERAALTLLSNRIYVIRQLALLLKAFGALMFIAAPGVREGIIQRDEILQLRLTEARHVA